MRVTILALPYATEVDVPVNSGYQLVARGIPLQFEERPCSFGHLTSPKHHLGRAKCAASSLHHPYMRRQPWEGEAATQKRMKLPGSALPLRKVFIRSSEALDASC